MIKGILMTCPLTFFFRAVNTLRNLLWRCGELCLNDLLNLEKLKK